MANYARSRISIENPISFSFADYNYVETCSDPVAYPEFYLQQLNALTSRGLPIDILAFQVSGRKQSKIMQIKRVVYDNFDRGVTVERLLKTADWTVARRMIVRAGK